MQFYSIYFTNFIFSKIVYIYIFIIFKIYSS